mmetsp:Transcript_27905/g.99284  ORF Transcript_27905/g.99284 Transcript_27905/m.99284 type:complete len:344 (+) Transcript_27905:1050-2081(+)
MQFLLRLSLSHLGRGKVDPLPQREVGALRALLEAASFPLEAPHVDCEPSRRRRSTDSNDVAYASLRAFFDSAVRMPLSEHAPETLRKLEAAFEFKTVVNAKGDTSDEGKRSPGDDGAPNANIEKGLARAGSLGGRSSPPPEPQEAPRRFARSSSSSSANGSARSLSSSSAGALAAAAKRERAEPAARAAAAEAEAVAKRLAESAAAADALQRVQKARPVRGGSAPMVPQCSPQKRKSTGNAAAPYVLRPIGPIGKMRRPIGKSALQTRPARLGNVVGASSYCARGVVHWSHATIRPGTARHTDRRPKRANPASPTRGLKGKPEPVAAPISGSSRRPRRDGADT